MFKAIRNFFSPQPQEPAPVYAAAGEKVTCENGHVICELAHTVRRGEPLNYSRNLVGWTQKETQQGAYPRSVCEQCGSPFYIGYILHFEQGWRSNGQHYETIEQWHRRP